MSFSCFAKKRTKRRRLRGTFRKGAPLRIPRRIAIRPPKMFRFSGVYSEKICKFLSRKRSKIGTFLDAGWRCGAGGS